MYSLTTLNVKRAKSIWPYIQIARIDHWFKNAFMLLGTLLAFFYEPVSLKWGSISQLGLAFIATCLVASSNYVVNELLDGPFDSAHPDKKHRPVPSGKVRFNFALLEWLFLGVAGVMVAFTINLPFGISAFVLLLMGITYNVPQVRTKDIPYVDVLSESFNNPIRLFLGWFVLVPGKIPPLSLILAYWMVGAFFMATKRFAEYRHIGNARIAAEYRRSFAHYTEHRLLISMFFYAITCALFSGIFIIRYRVELILAVPVTAGFFAYYLKLGLQPNSPVQHPERLYREQGFVSYLLLAIVWFVMLMLLEVPALYETFHVEPARIAPLWTIGVEVKR
jgi:4-hydroxybenzoate polyprenyltransferase